MSVIWERSEVVGVGKVEEEGVVVIGVFFFQAEDGIRDLVRSRGLGDVYKRQPHRTGPPPGAGRSGSRYPPPSAAARSPARPHTAPVSYTHLTLPTIYSV